MPGGTAPLELPITIADLGEFGLIAAIRSLLPPPGAAQLLGIGDDAAVIAAPDRRVVATTDLMVEGRHFRRDWSSAADIGAKAAAQNLADVAAMGASPTALLVGLAAPGDLPVSWAQDLVRGMAQECERGGADIAGGDISGADTVMLAVTALGDLAGGSPVTRSGARPGDLLALAGRPGRSAAGLALLQAGLASPQRNGEPAGQELSGLIASHRRPQPPYDAGPQAAQLGATAMIDVSDGLLADLGHIAAASGVSIDVRTHQLPAGPDLQAAAAALTGPGGVAGPGGADRPGGTEGRGSAEWLDWALTGGEDHILAATFPPDTPLPARWQVIGAVSAGHGVTVDSRPAAGPGGWRHFAG